MPCSWMFYWNWSWTQSWGTIKWWLSGTYSVFFIETKLMFVKWLQFRGLPEQLLSPQTYNEDAFFMQFKVSDSIMCNLPSHCICMYGTACLSLLLVYPRCAMWYLQHHVWLSCDKSYFMIVGFEILTMVTMKSTVFWDLMLFGLVVHQCFRGTSMNFYWTWCHIPQYGVLFLLLLIVKAEKTKHLHQYVCV